MKDISSHDKRRTGTGGDDYNGKWSHLIQIGSIYIDITSSPLTTYRYQRHTSHHL